MILTAHVGLQDGSDPEIDSVNKFLREADCGDYGGFVEVSEQASGTKYMECRVYLSAFNHADTETILKAIDQAPWRDKEMVQVFVKEQEEEPFRLRYSGGSNGRMMRVSRVSGDHVSAQEFRKMRILTSFLLVLGLLGICEAGQEVVQYSKTRNVSTLSGMVVDRNGAMIPDAQVCSMSAGWKTELECTATDSDGRWALSVKPKEKLYYLRFVKANFNQVWIKARVTTRKAASLSVEMPVAT